MRHPRIALFSPILEHCLKNTTNTYTKVSKFHAKWPPKCILHPKVCEKKPAQKAKEYIPYCNHIRFADRGWEETVDTLEIVGAILHFFKSSKTFRANEVQKINFFCRCSPIDQLVPPIWILFMGFHFPQQDSLILILQFSKP